MVNDALEDKAMEAADAAATESAEPPWFLGFSEGFIAGHRSALEGAAQWTAAELADRISVMPFDEMVRTIELWHAAQIKELMDSNMALIALQAATARALAPEPVEPGGG